MRHSNKVRLDTTDVLYLWLTHGGLSFILVKVAEPKLPSPGYSTSSFNEAYDDYVLFTKGYTPPPFCKELMLHIVVGIILACDWSIHDSCHDKSWYYPRSAHALMTGTYDLLEWEVLSRYYTLDQIGVYVDRLAYFMDPLVEESCQGFLDEMAEGGLRA